MASWGTAVSDRQVEAIREPVREVERPEYRMHKSPESSGDFDFMNLGASSVERSPRLSSGQDTRTVVTPKNPHDYTTHPADHIEWARIMTVPPHPLAVVHLQQQESEKASIEKSIEEKRRRLEQENANNMASMSSMKVTSPLHTPVAVPTLGEDYVNPTMTKPTEYVNPNMAKPSPTNGSDVDPINIFMDYLDALGATSTWSKYFTVGDYSGDTDNFREDIDPADYIASVIPLSDKGIYIDKTFSWIDLEVQWVGVVKDLQLTDLWSEGHFDIN